eukprot:2253076-Rhodomonas_salina.1
MGARSGTHPMSLCPSYAMSSCTDRACPYAHPTPCPSTDRACPYAHPPTPCPAVLTEHVPTYTLRRVRY